MSTSRSGMFLSVALALAASSMPTIALCRSDDLRRATEPEPINTGRRSEKDAEAMRKAQAKRERKAAKRKKEQS